MSIFDGLGSSKSLSSASTRPADAQLLASPWALDYNQFSKALAPYITYKEGDTPEYADKDVRTNFLHDSGSTTLRHQISNGTTSLGEKDRSGLGLQLSNGQVWRPSGADSGVTFHPKGEVTLTPGTEFKGRVTQDSYSAPNPVDYWDVSGDMSALLGRDGSDMHQDIRYERMGDKVVPVTHNYYHKKPNGTLWQELGDEVVDAVTSPQFAGFATLASMGASGAFGSASASGSAGAGGVAGSTSAGSLGSGTYGLGADLTSTGIISSTAPTTTTAMSAGMGGAATNSAGVMIGNGAATSTASGLAGAMGMNSGMGATALNSGAVNAGINLAQGGDLKSATKAGLQGAALSGASGYVSGAISNNLPGGINPSLGKAISTTGAGTAIGGLSSMVSGGSIKDGMVRGATNGIANSAGNYVGGLTTGATGSSTLGGGSFWRSNCRTEGRRRLKRNGGRSH